jgi:hypothetical protein
MPRLDVIGQDQLDLMDHLRQGIGVPHGISRPSWHAP